jgi:hypothetical protein
MQVGDKVKIIRTESSFYNRVFWWPDGGMTGTVEALHKNGSIRIACDQLSNTSKDGKISKTFKKGEIVCEVI